MPGGLGSTPTSPVAGGGKIVGMFCDTALGTVCAAGQSFCCYRQGKAAPPETLGGNWYKTQDKNACVPAACLRVCLAVRVLTLLAGRQLLHHEGPALQLHRRRLRARGPEVQVRGAPQDKRHALNAQRCVLAQQHVFKSS